MTKRTLHFNACCGAAIGPCQRVLNAIVQNTVTHAIKLDGFKVTKFLLFLTYIPLRARNNV